MCYKFIYQLMVIRKYLKFYYTEMFKMRVQCCVVFSCSLLPQMRDKYSMFRRKLGQSFSQMTFLQTSLYERKILKWLHSRDRIWNHLVHYFSDTHKILSQRISKLNDLLCSNKSPHQLTGFLATGSHIIPLFVCLKKEVSVQRESRFL